MYSNSNSYLGGGNSSRPGLPQYGQSSFMSVQQGQPQGQQQANSFAPQPTGFGTAPMQSQYTGYPGPGQQQGFQAPPQQPQFTGYQPQNQQPLQNQPPPRQAFQNGQPSQALVPPQATGQTSSQIAQSFQSTSSAPPTAQKPSTGSTKIPKIRLSFLTAQDQAKFEQLFKSAVGDGQALSGMKES